MANTVIQLKYSNVTGTPPSLNLAEPAYSNVSNKLWINDGDAVVAIAGKYYTDLIDAGTNLATGNTLVRRSTSGNFSANTVTVDTLTANVSILQNGFNLYDFANAAFTQANTAIVAGGEIAGGYANSAYNQANTATQYATSAGVYANAAYDQANTGTQYATSAGDYANSAYAHANTKFASAGGTITGDVIVNANLTVSGLTTYVNTQTILVSDNILSLNADIPVDMEPSEDSGIEIARGVQPNAQFIWVESAGKWSASDGNTSFFIGSEAGESYANSAYNQANTATSSATAANAHAASGYDQANTAFDAANSTFLHANSAYNQVNVTTQYVTSASDYANSAYLKANSGYTAAVTAGIYANSAYDLANTDVTNINTTAGVFGSESIVPVFNIAANGRVFGVTNTTISIGASQITSGTLPVSRGGTGNTTFTTNHVLLGSGTDAVTTTGSSTEGHILTINSSGVPTFQYLNGGSF